MATPDYVLMEAYSFYLWSNTESKTLEVGSFVRPVDPSYLPAHVMKDDRFKNFDPNTQVFCYCRYGLVPIPKKIVRRA